jgi:phage tail sheath protein FI
MTQVIHETIQCALRRAGAFQGKTPRKAYFVTCDKETTTQNDINLGIVNILVGSAPLKPSEFAIIKMQQIAGKIAAWGGIDGIV